MACVVLVKCPAAVPCATTDEESGSKLKLGLWCWPCSGCFRWRDTLRPSWIPCGLCFGILPYPFCFLLLPVSSVHLLGGLYSDVSSDVINVYRPPGTDICVTFKSPLMRGRFTYG